MRGCVGALTLDFEANFSAPWTVLFGPSGCGKSTLLRAICGLQQDLAIQCLRYQASGAAAITLQTERQAVPSERRDMAYAPQGAGLFPHLSVAKNVEFPQSVRSISRIGYSNASNTDELLDLLQLKTLATRLPRELSGGQRQRVSLARALAVPNARLVLLDEPFSGVDRALRDELLPRVQQHLAGRGVPVISVTHDVDEAFLLGAEVIRLLDGKNAAQGPATAILAREAQVITRLLQQN